MRLIDGTLDADVGSGNNRRLHKRTDWGLTPTV